MIIPLLLTSLACGPSPSTSDGGDAGSPDGGGEGPRFVQAPRVQSTEARALVLAWETDVPTHAEVAWLGGGDTGVTTAGDFLTARTIRVEGLPPGRSLRLQVVAYDQGNRAVGAALEARTGLLRTSPARVLFDAAHGQRAGNADWIVDTSGRDPTPANPSVEDDWNGAYSAFGVDLVRTGRFVVEILTDGESFGQGGVALAGYDLVVIPEPNNRLGGTEIDALDAYLRGGGGLLLIGNHGGSDRDNDGWDAVDVLNEALQGKAWGAALIGDRLSGAARATPDDALTDGPFGTADALGAFAGSSVRLEAGLDTDLRVVASVPGRATLALAGRVGQGRLLLHGDSSAADDGTDSGGNTNIYDAWHDPEQTNAAFFLNAASWLAGEY
ncbi:MAG: hypothetical protein P1V51_22625 [Deltaproteobacteria bacterium]|nr:hypothetical protein [Deltaproteobacteria bacterium]